MYAVLVGNSAGRVESINISRGGVPKTSVREAAVTPDGIEGDKQKVPLLHGGPTRAVCLYSLELIRALQAEGHPIAPGTIGENLTVSGLDWSTVLPGRELRIGTIRLVATAYASPCLQIRHSFLNGDYKRVSPKLHPGWSRVYAAVTSSGIARTGDPIELVSAEAHAARRV